MAKTNSKQSSKAASSGVQPSAQHRTEAQPLGSVQPSAKPRAQANAKSSAKTGTKTDAQSGAKTNTQAKTSARRSKFHWPACLRRFAQKVRTYRAHRVRLHRSFRRSYREDYQRPTSTPGLLSHAMETFQLIGRFWRTFVPFIALIVGLYIVLVGLMSEDFYREFQTSIDESSASLAAGEIGNFGRAALLLLSTVTTGGLDSGMDEVGIIFAVILFLIVWLVTIFLLRHFLAGGRPKLRDGLYNALAPLLSTLLVFAVMFIQAIPVMLVVITYNAAVVTGFLSTPFYALVYFIFAALMILLSCYLLSSSIIALVAVAAPGTYPLAALTTASDLMAGRRSRFVLRIIFLVIVVALIYIIIMLPIILLDLWLKSFLDFLVSWPIVPFCLLVVTCFVFVYITAYIYRYYRYLLDYREN